MPTMPDFLGRMRPEAELQRRFLEWGQPPQSKPITWGSALPVIDSPVTHPSAMYSPALVIGLGDLGETVMRQWVRQFSQSDHEPQTAVRVMLLTEKRPAAPLVAEGVHIRQLDFSAIADSRPADHLGRRAEMRARFRYVQISKSFQEWLQTCLLDLHRNIQVLIIGSLREAMIGTLGEVLQALRQAPETNINPYLSITALLSFDTPKPALALEEGDVYAALREVSRFTFSGLHSLEPFPGQRPNPIQTALLDQVFIVEKNSTVLESSATPFDEETGAALAETLFTLLHPAGRFIWENLTNNLRQSGQARESHVTVMHGLGIATLAVPLLEVQDYVAARLTGAVLLGEHPHRPAEGLIGEIHLQADLAADGALIASRWLRNGPCRYGLFDWLLDAASPVDFRALPPVTREADTAFQCQIAYGLYELLNNRDEANQFAKSQAALRWLIQWLEKLQQWLSAATPARSGLAAPAELAEALKRWLETVKHLQRQMELWEQAILAHPANSQKAPATFDDSTAWRRSGQNKTSTHANGSTATGPGPSPIQGTLSQQLQLFRQSAEAKLSSMTDGPVRRAVTTDSSRRLNDVDLYYTQSVRPELREFNPDAGAIFRRLRDRVRWWIELTPSLPPKIYIAGIPADASLEAVDRPPLIAKFEPKALGELIQTLLQTARLLAKGIETDLTGVWFQNRLVSLAGFLSRSADPLLHYDQNAAAHLPYAATRRAYLIGRTKTVTGSTLSLSFPNYPAKEIAELDGGDPARLTGLTLWLNIPVDTILTARALYSHYAHRPGLHLYPQETVATEYERRWRDLIGDQLVLFPPDLTLALANSKLVTLFCQAVICELIAVQQSEIGRPPYWVVRPVEPELGPLVLAPADADGLWNALRRFALELPNDPVQDFNPVNHFHSRQEDRFLAALHAEARDCQRKPAFIAQRETFRKSILADWKKRGERDVFAAAFTRLLEVELDEPLWKGW